jgi:hypothetical protein
LNAKREETKAVDRKGPFSLCIYKEGLCPSSGDWNRLMLLISAMNVLFLT